MINIDLYEKQKAKLCPDSINIMEWYKAIKNDTNQMQIRFTSSVYHPNEILNSFNIDKDEKLTMFKFYDKAFNELISYKIIEKVDKQIANSVLENGYIEFGVIFTIS